MRVRFCGAARQVTGSRHLLEVGGKRVLLDCGLVQGRRSDAEARNRDFGFDPADIDAVVLSHAHIDHSGALPSLVARGFAGRVHATLATADLASIMLLDSGNIQENDAEVASRRRARKGEPPVAPLYTVDDARRAGERLTAHPYHQPVAVLPGVTATFYDAGHILGSAVVSLEVEDEGRRRTIVFTGDLGRRGLPILRDPETPEQADALIIESTYGDRLHAPVEQVDRKLADLINRVVARRGRIIVPAFAVGRTQELCFALSRLLRAGHIPDIAIYVDSPLAVNVTEVFARHPECFDSEIADILAQTGDPFGLEKLRYLRTREESMALNELARPFLVISASGMCEAGRILHHLRNGIEDPRNAILIVGYQAEHTLGRRLVDGAEVVKIFGESYERRAEVVVMNEFSAHADRAELLAWIAAFRRKPDRVFVVHGEEDQSLPFAAALAGDAAIPSVVVPHLGEIHGVDPHRTVSSRT